MEMKKEIIIAGAAILLALAAAAHLLTGSSTPRGQDALLKLSQANFQEFKTAFDHAADGPRLVLLLSPT
jgi:hypothetical protein